MLKTIFFALMIACLAPSAINAQTKQESPARQPSADKMSADKILAVAAEYLRQGEACFNTGDYECARREFDRAVDYVLELGLDLRSDEQLHKGWRAMIEKINRYQLDALSETRAGNWKTQEFNGRPVEEKTEIAAGEDNIFDGPLTPEAFQRQFAELRKVFREKYDRDIVLTGADHGEHRRLYGRGSAFDIRARDLNREQVNFIIATGTKLGLRIKDFSTWQKVAAHNSRTFSLGRPLDTLATGLHLHIDRMAPTKNRSMVSKPVISSKERNRPGSK